MYIGAETLRSILLFLPSRKPSRALKGFTPWPAAPTLARLFPYGITQAKNPGYLAASMNTSTTCSLTHSPSSSYFAAGRIPLRGLDAGPVINWAAGAGLDAVLDNGEEMLNQIFPNGIQSSVFSASDGGLSIGSTN
jgi:hypothetical protein